MKKIVLFLLFILAVGAGGYFYYNNFVTPKVVHIHGGFRVFVEGGQVDFSDAKYMHAKPCTTDDSVAEVDEQMEKAHLHDFTGDVVHVHRSNALWGDLFRNIKYEIDSSKEIVAYINGREVKNVLNYPIKVYDSLILLVGKHGDPSTYLQTAVKKDYIQRIEQKSEDCGAS